MSRFRRRQMLAAAVVAGGEVTPGSDGKFWVYYNVITTEEPTTLLGWSAGMTNTMEVDGVEMPLAYSYTFPTTGVHLVKFGYNGGQLDGNFNNVPQILEIYFPNLSVAIATRRDRSPIYSITAPAKIYVPGPINNVIACSYSCSPSLNVEIELNGVTNWALEVSTDCIRKVTIKGTFSSMPAYGYTGFGANSAYEYIWIESPNLTTIGDNFGSNMQNLVTMVMNVTTPPVVSSSGFFKNGNSSFKLYVPYSADHSILAAYQAADVWSTRASQMYELNPDGTIPT